MALKFYLTITLLCLLAPTTYNIGHAQQTSSADEPQKRSDPQPFLSMGPMKVAVSYKENKYNERLKISKSTMNYFMTNESDPHHKHLLKLFHREDLVRCENIVDNMPEMDSLLDCKPLVTGIVSVDQSAAGYVKRTIIGAKGWLVRMLSLIGFDSKVELHSYPFDPDFTDQSIKRIFRESELSHAFGPHSSSSGHFLVFNATEGVPCTGSLFFSVNLTSATPDQNLNESYSEFVQNAKHSVTMFLKNGGLVSLQDVSCGLPGISGISVDSDFTLIRRKQFPYITCKHNIVTKPFRSFWAYTGEVKQMRDDQHTEAYNTSIQIHSKSSLVTHLNFELNQNFTNKDFTSGAEEMFLVHPALFASVHGQWSESYLEKLLMLFFGQYPWTDMRTSSLDEFDEPKIVLRYEDDVDREHITLKLTIDRNLLVDGKDSEEEPTEDSPETAKTQEQIVTAQMVEYFAKLLQRDEL